MATSTRSESGLRRAFSGCLGVPFVAGNHIEVLRNGVQAFPAMLAAIEAAERSIEFATFVYWRGAIAERFAQALARRAQAGVRVLVLLDAVGSMPMPEQLVEHMQAHGVEVAKFRPVTTWKVWKTTHRTHRKILVCDGQVGFTGGFGIAEQWEGDARHEGEWRDTHFRVTGPVVHGLQAAFCGNWLETGRPVVDAMERVQALEPAGDCEVMALRSTASPRWSDVATLLRLLIAGAKQRLRIATAYFVPDERCVELLMDAVQRGVQVDVLVPGPHVDTRVSKLAGADAYQPLLDAGVRIHEFQPSMMHCKAITVDGQIACIGSANFNQRSMSQDDEICLVVDHREFVQVLDEHFEADLERSHRIDCNGWRRRGLWQRAAEAVSSLVRPQV